MILRSIRLPIWPSLVQGHDRSEYRGTGFNVFPGSSLLLQSSVELG